MTEVCEYTIIRDGSFQLKKDEDEKINFDLPNDVKTNRNSVLIFNCDPTSSARNLKCHIEINTEEVKSISMTGGVSRTRHEVVGGNVLKQGENKIEFEVTSGRGSVYFSDVVLLWRRDV